MSNSVSIDALRPEVWERELYKDVMDNMYFTSNGMMGKGTNQIVEVKDDLSKQKGDGINIGLTARLTGSGVSGDSELEGNEEAILPYSERVAIDQIRHAVRLTGLLDEQKNAYDMRMDAKNKLSIWLQEFIERQVFLKLGGVDNVALVDRNSVTVGARAQWSNTPDLYPAADEAAGYGDRYLCADASGLDSLAATDVLTLTLITKAKRKAMMANPRIRPLKIKGKEYYIMFVHPDQAVDLKISTTAPYWAQAQREAQSRGGDNPVFTGALGIWDGVILHEHEYVPTILGTTAQTTTSYFSTSGTAVPDTIWAYRSLLCGQQAAVMAKCQNKKGWVEKLFDYDNKTGFATRLIGGIQKVMFNSKEYGVIAVDTGATVLN